VVDQAQEASETDHLRDRVRELERFLQEVRDGKHSLQGVLAQIEKLLPPKKEL